MQNKSTYTKPDIQLHSINVINSVFESLDSYDNLIFLNEIKTLEAKLYIN